MATYGEKPEDPNMDEPLADPARLRDICVRYGVASLMVFGSVARDEARADSDVDLLYELTSGTRLGWEIEDFCVELNALFGRPVDLVQANALHPLLRQTVLAEAKPLYSAD
jgi:uncharacterized protein